MTRTTPGACLCGTVSFQISGEFDRFFLCHCGRCRKGSGSAHAANLFSSTATIEWLSGEEEIRSYRVPESRHVRTFCAQCGSAVPTVYGGGALLVVPAGSLEGPVDTRPSAHICLGSKADWDTGLEDVPGLDGMPG